MLLSAHPGNCCPNTCPCHNPLSSLTPCTYVLCVPASQGYQDEVAAAGSGLASYFSVFHKLLANRLGGLAGLVRRAAEQQQQLAQRAQQRNGEGEVQAGDEGETLRSAVAAEMGSLVKELQGSCEHSLHTYLHVQVRGPGTGGRQEEGF